MKHILINFFGLVLCFVIITTLHSQPKYRTFSQISLAEKKATAGKVLSSDVTFIFKNDSTGLTINSLHARLNSKINRIIDSGGFTNIVIREKGKIFTATGRSVAAGDSVKLIFNLDKKGPGSQANFWWWDTNGVRVGSKRPELAGTFTAISIQPNGGNVRDYIYKHIIHSRTGVVIGMVTDTDHVGWIRYKTADRKYFPHSDVARCFDKINTGSSTRPFDHKLQNPHVRKHNNHLLGEVHALKLAIIANDSGATQPLDVTTLGDLIYNDLGNPGDPGNGLTLRKLTAFVDSALTYCKHFDLNPGIYAKLDTCISRINRAFDGPYVAVRLMPFLLAGTHTVGESPYIHPNPTITPIARRGVGYSIIDQLPESSTLEQNYPNPFNPTTTIEFTLLEPSIVTLKVYNLLGQEVKTLIENELMEDGLQTNDFDASDLTSGVYFYKITAQGVGENQQQFQAIKRMVLVK